MTFSPSRFTSVPAAPTGEAAMSVINSLQDFPPEVQLAGLTVAFACMMERCDIDYPQAFQVARNLLNKAAHSVPELRAVVSYVAKEL